jgi:hypothetical protein
VSADDETIKVKWWGVEWWPVLAASSDEDAYGEEATVPKRLFEEYRAARDAFLAAEKALADVLDCDVAHYARD